MNNKYIQAFRESCKKLEEKQNFSNWYWNDIPPEKFTDRELEAKSQFDRHIEDFQNGLITRKELAYKLYELIDALPDSDWTRDSDAKLPDELFPESYKKLKEDTYSFNKLRSQRNPLAQTKQERNAIFNELKKEFNQYGINDYTFMKTIVNHPNEIELERNINLNDANIGKWDASNFKVLARNNLLNLKDLNLMDNFYKLKKVLYPNDSDYVAMIKILYKFNQVDGFNKKI